MYTKPVIFIIFILCFAITAQAELFYCEGTWTNRNCNGEASRVLHEIPSRKSIDPASKIFEKKTLLHDLSMSAARARRNYEISTYDINTEINEIRAFCLEESSSLNNCRERVRQVEDRIENRVTSVRLVRSRERERREAERRRAEPQIVVVQQQHYPYRDYYGYRRPIHRFRKRVTRPESYGYTLTQRARKRAGKPLTIARVPSSP